jgi:DNA-directed RNA polymerase subunit RPC12/RpoP
MLAEQLDLFGADTDYDATPTRLCRPRTHGHPQLRGHLWLQGCHRCRGTLVYDEEGDDVVCVQCGGRRDAGAFVGERQRVANAGRCAGRAGASWWR